MSQRFAKVVLYFLLGLLSLPFIAGVLTISRPRLSPPSTQRISLISEALPSMGTDKIIFQSLENLSYPLSRLGIRFRLPADLPALSKVNLSLLKGAEAPKSKDEARARTVMTREVLANELVSGDVLSWPGLNVGPETALLIEYSGNVHDGVGVWGVDSRQWKSLSAQAKPLLAVMLTSNLDGQLQSSVLNASLAMEFSNDKRLGFWDTFVRKVQNSPKVAVTIVFLALSGFTFILWSSLQTSTGNMPPVSFKSRAGLYFACGIFVAIAASFLVSDLPEVLLDRGIHAESFYGQF